MTTDSGQKIPNSFTMESFPYFERVDDDKKIIMHFNSYQRWDGDDNISNGSDEFGKVVERWYNSELCFEWNQNEDRFMLRRFHFAEYYYYYYYD